MRWGLLGIRLGMLGINLVIIAIILMSLLPLLSGALEVRMPEGQESWQVEDDYITLSQPVSITNEGFYDMEDFTVRFLLEDVDGNVITDYENLPVDINTGGTTDVNINLRIDMDDIGEEGMRNLVFNGTTFDMLVELRTDYMLNLVTLMANVSEEMGWDPLINDYGLDTHGIHHSFQGDRLEIVAPFFVDASEMMDGRTVNIDCTLRNSTSTLSTASESITLNGYTEGQLDFLLDPSTSAYMANHSEELTFDLEVEAEGVTVEESVPYQWEGA
ncbi:MAG: hypothetical protein ACLFUV_06670 [Methanomassiliicoccales archaeon]